MEHTRILYYFLAKIIVVFYIIFYQLMRLNMEKVAKSKNILTLFYRAVPKRVLAILVERTLAEGKQPLQ